MYHDIIADHSVDNTIYYDISFDKHLSTLIDNNLKPFSAIEFSIDIELDLKLKLLVVDDEELDKTYQLLPIFRANPNCLVMTYCVIFYLIFIDSYIVVKFRVINLNNKFIINHYGTFLKTFTVTTTRFNLFQHR